MIPKFFTVDNSIFLYHFEVIMNKELKRFKNDYLHAVDKGYFLEVKRQNLWRKICGLNSSSGSLGQFISECKNKMLLDNRLTSLEIVDQHCSKLNLDVELTIKNIAEITALYDFFDILIEKQRSIIKVKNKKEKKPKCISINPEFIPVLYHELTPFFHDSERQDLLKLLKGEQIKGKLTFGFNANRFVELFGRVKYNGYITENKTNLKNWILTFFRFKNESSGKILEFKDNTIHAILYGKTSAQPKKSQRILTIESLPYKTQDQQKQAINRTP